LQDDWQLASSYEKEDDGVVRKELHGSQQREIGL